MIDNIEEFVLHIQEEMSVSQEVIKAFVPKHGTNYCSEDIYTVKNEVFSYILLGCTATPLNSEVYGYTHRVYYYTHIS